MAVAEPHLPSGCESGMPTDSLPSRSIRTAPCRRFSTASPTITATIGPAPFVTALIRGTPTHAINGPTMPSPRSRGQIPTCASLPEVDASNVGITGISWGGYLTCLAASIDPRFKFAVPVYGCGFLDEGPTWSAEINEYGHDRWMQHWDPSSHLSRVECPMLWVNGTNDRHYYLPMFQQSYRLPSGPRSLSVRVRMEHGNTAGWSPPEIYEFAKAAVGKGKPLVQVTRHTGNPRVASAKYQAPSDTAVESAELVYTLDRGDWYNRQWQTTDAKVDADRSQVSAKLPADVAVYYFNLRDNRGLTVSSEHVVVPPAGEHPPKNPK